jgi:hypothetical protein
MSLLDAELEVVSATGRTVAGGTEVDLPLLATVLLPTAEAVFVLAPTLRERLPLHALSTARAAIDNKNLT